ncbi:MAG: divergent PAP2 family protein [Candidatus Melainabacteria bacterium]|nr:divergent PAP2 family protein [Candidatus Gastranaerophilales bacterium]UKI42003.1 MAG: divergent PAP2 family protein [Candidatus Melainabacteria bacterium]
MFNSTNSGLFMLFTGIEAAIIAQLLKFFGYMIINRKIDWRMLVTTGGMPSSHSAGVVGLTTAVAIVCGLNSVEFAIAATYALVVMYDAAGLRRSAGKMAQCLNRIMDDIYQHNPIDAGDKLKELLGHTPLEVFFGAITGIVIAYINFVLLV